MKKVILWIAILLVAFVPTYILVFQGIKTAVPDVYLGEEEISPAYMTWVTVDGEGNEKNTSPLQGIMDFIFSHTETRRLKSLGDLGNLTFEQTPEAVVELYDAPDAAEPCATYTLDEIAAGVPAPTVPVQVVLRLEWVVSDRVNAIAAYSFEMMPPETSPSVTPEVTP